MKFTVTLEDVSEAFTTDVEVEAPCEPPQL